MSKKTFYFFSVLLFAVVCTFPVTVHAQTNFNLYLVDVGKSSVDLNYTMLGPDELLCVEVDGTTYRSAYGAGGAGHNTVINFPLQPIGKEVSIWTENRNGNVSQIFKKSIIGCNIEIDSYMRDVTATMVKGRLFKFSGNHEYVIIKIGNHEYRSDVTYAANNRDDYLPEFTVTYPSQKNVDTLSVTAFDSHGCMSKTVTRKIDKGNIYPPIIEPSNVLKTEVRLANSVYKDEKLYMQFGDNLYSSEMPDSRKSEYIFTYPEQEIGTIGTFWIETKEGYYSDEVSFKVHEKPLSLGKSVKLYPNSILGSANYDMEWSVDEDGNKTEIENWETVQLKSVVANIEDNTYTGKVNGAQYEVQFPVHKIGSKVSITMTDQFGYTATKSYTIKNTPILLELNPIYYGDEKITGNTLPESKVSATMNKKTFHGIADKKGKFSIRIPSGKTGNKVLVKSIAPNTCYNSKSTAVQKISSNIFIMNFVFPNTTTLKVNCENVFKGDVVKISIGGNEYTKNITANAKDKNLTFSIKKASVGTNIKAGIYDKYGVKRNQYNSEVYLSDKISTGMTKKQVLQTTWGSPNIKSIYSGWDLWVYDGRHSISYVYFKNNKVISIYQYNY